MKVVALDIGGTRLKGGLVAVGEDDVVVEHRLTPSEVAGLDADGVLATAATMIDALDEDGDAALALAVPGLVDGARIASLPGKFPGLEGRHLGDALAPDGRRRVVVVNDAVAHGLGEARAGAGKGTRRSVTMTIGTGVGVAVVVDGRPVSDGPVGGGILGGQIPISDPTGPTDTAGRQGTIEARCRAQRIVEEVREAGGDVDTVPRAIDLARAGDPAAVAGLRSYVGWLVRAIVALAHAHAPDVVILGGGPIQPEDPLLAGVQQQVDDATWPGYRVDVRTAALGDDAALLGAASLAAGP